MIKFILIVIIFIVIFSNPQLIIFIVSNIHNFILWFIKDSYKYFKHHEFDRCREYGKIRLNCASSSQVFGCGKTLMLVIMARYYYHRFNDKLVWSESEQKLVKQKIHIISNVELYDIPYIKFTGLNQFIDIDKFEFGSEDVTIFLLDESGAIFNSREYRNNISTDFLTRLLQSRKHKVALYMTSQRFQFTDKILREVCDQVTTCRKWWRIVKTCNYDAFELENALNPSMIKPTSISYRFIFDSDYHSYNSYQLVEELRKDYDPNDFLDTKEILDTYGSSDGSLDRVSRPSRKAKRRIINTFK